MNIWIESDSSLVVMALTTTLWFLAV